MHSEPSKVKPCSKLVICEAVLPNICPTSPIYCHTLYHPCIQLSQAVKSCYWSNSWLCHAADLPYRWFYTAGMGHELHTPLYQQHSLLELPVPLCFVKRVSNGGIMLPIHDKSHPISHFTSISTPWFDVINSID